MATTTAIQIKYTIPNGKPSLGDLKCKKPVFASDKVCPFAKNKIMQII
jgi:hypothetical protein